MTVCIPSRVAIFVMWIGGFCTPTIAVGMDPVVSPHGSPFTRVRLLRRFDTDRDGRLRRSERAALREAFSGLDVPMLPSSPLCYSEPKRPDYLNSTELQESDSTLSDNPITDRGATLGRVLFYDTQLSRNNTVACASCHLQRAAFSDPRRFSMGFEGGETKRNAMGLANLRYSNLRGSRPGFFWDERAPTLEAQCLMPIQDEVEMGMELPALNRKLQRLPYYPRLFREAFGSTEITSQRIARAIAQFLRSLESWDSMFDRAASRSGRPTDYAKDFADFTPAQNRGKALFVNGVGGIAEFGCAHCHIPPTFGMAKSLNNGLTLEYEDPGLGALDVPSNDPFTPSNDGKFKAPSLRNIELTAPYMHDGRFDTLESVVEHYSRGVHPHANLGLALENEPLAGETSGFEFTDEQKSALVAFLKTLTDKTFISDPRFADPFVRADSAPTEPTE